jgi:hypothetical protein
MKKEILDSTAFTFDASAKTITFTEDLTLSQILNTITMSDTDDLQIIVYRESADATRDALLEIIRKQTEVQDEMLVELQACHKYLRKIYNPE